jgi:hypothetical protein
MKENILLRPGVSPPKGVEDPGRASNFLTTFLFLKNLFVVRPGLSRLQKTPVLRRQCRHTVRLGSSSLLETPGLQRRDQVDIDEIIKSEFPFTQHGKELLSNARGLPPLALRPQARVYVFDF